MLHLVCGSLQQIASVWGDCSVVRNEFTAECL